MTTTCSARITSVTAHPFSTQAEGAGAVYRVQGRAMRLDEAVGVITAAELIRGCRDGIAARAKRHLLDAAHRRAGREEASAHTAQPRSAKYT